VTTSYTSPSHFSDFCYHQQPVMMLQESTTLPCYEGSIKLAQVQKQIAARPPKFKSKPTSCAVRPLVYLWRSKQLFRRRLSHTVMCRRHGLSSPRVGSFLLFCVYLLKKSFNLVDVATLAAPATSICLLRSNKSSSSLTVLPSSTSSLII